MPKVSPPADSIQEFRLDNDFQPKFNSWKAHVEEDGRYSLEITHEEPIHQGTGLLLFWPSGSSAPVPPVGGLPTGFA